MVSGTLWYEREHWFLPGRHHLSRPTAPAFLEVKARQVAGSELDRRYPGRDHSCFVRYPDGSNTFIGPVRCADRLWLLSRSCGLCENRYSKKAAPIIMSKYAVGDRVSWNSEAGRVTGRIIKVHYQDFEYKGYRHRASKDVPQYEIKSDKSDHIAAHKESALTNISD